MFDFNSFTIPARGTVVEAPKEPKNAGRKILKAGDYQYTITEVKKGQIVWKTYGNTTPKVTLTLDVEGVRISNIDIILSTSKKYLDTLYAFAQSVGYDTSSDLRIDWDGLVGAHGWAHIEPKHSAKYGTIHEVTAWLDPADFDEEEDDEEETYASLKKAYNADLDDADDADDGYYPF